MTRNHRSTRLWRNLPLFAVHVPTLPAATRSAIPHQNATPRSPAAGSAFGAELWPGRAILPDAFIGDIASEADDLDGLSGRADKWPVHATTRRLWPDRGVRPGQRPLT